MRITVFGATGHLGRHVLAALAGHDIVAAGRDTAKVKNLPVRPVRVDYDEPPTIRAALAGTDRVLLISGFDFGRRVQQHAAVVDAARDAGVSFLAYTSTPHATESGMRMAAEHAATEALIDKSGIPYAILRNSMYLEVLTEQIAPQAAADGFLASASGPGRISPAARADLAAAAAEVLTGDGHAGRTYELGGHPAVTMAEVAAAVAASSGRPVEYRPVTVAEFTASLPVPPAVAEIFADTQLGIARDEFYVPGDDLARLIGRPPRSLDEALRQP